MVGDEVTRAAWLRAQAACGDSARRLGAADIAPEALAQYVAERGAFVWRRKPTMRPLGMAWRLGTLLIRTDGALYAHGRSTRAAERGRPSFQSESREERREIAAAALRGGFGVGTPVSYDALLLLGAASPCGDDLAGAVFDPDLAAAGSETAGSETARSGAAARELPVGLAGGEVRVRWRAGAPLAGAQTLADFLSERVELLINPPFSRG